MLTGDDEITINYEWPNNTLQNISSQKLCFKTFEKMFHPFFITKIKPSLMICHSIVLTLSILPLASLSKRSFKNKFCIDFSC